MLVSMPRNATTTTFLILFCALSQLGTVSCSGNSAQKNGGDSTSCRRGPGSMTYHAAGEPTLGNDLFQWVDVGDETLSAHRRTILPPLSRGRLVSADDPRTLHYQQTVDAIDTWVRHKWPERLSNTPKPKVRIYDSEVNNAWASGVPVCIDAPVRFDAQTPSPRGRDYYTAILHHAYVEPMKEHTGGFFGQPRRPLEDCVQAPQSALTQAFVQWINHRHGPCRYTLQDGHIHVSGEACRVRGYAPDFAGATHARYHAVIPYVFITTRLIEFIDDEEQVLSVIAHELAHYYRSHATNSEFQITGNIFEGERKEHFSAQSAGYNFFYTQSRIPQRVRPTPREDSDQVRDQALLFAPNQKNVAKNVAQTRLDPTLAKFMMSLVYTRGMLPRDEVASCQRAYKIYMGNDFYNFGLEELTSTQKEGYRRLEASFLACAQAVDVPSDLSFDEVKSSYSKPMKLELPHVTMAGNLYDIILELDALMRSYSEREVAFHDFLQRERIGFYTAEQEADELGAELLAGIGVDPVARARLDLRRGAWREAEAPDMFWRTNGITMARCQSLFENDWNDPETGEYVFVPFGSLVDIHHGPCYRAFNISREVKAHGWQE